MAGRPFGFGPPSKPEGHGGQDGDPETIKWLDDLLSAYAEMWKPQTSHLIPVAQRFAEWVVQGGVSRTSTVATVADAWIRWLIQTALEAQQASVQLTDLAVAGDALVALTAGDGTITGSGSLALPPLGTGGEGTVQERGIPSGVFQQVFLIVLMWVIILVGPVVKDRIRMSSETEITVDDYYNIVVGMAITITAGLAPGIVRKVRKK